MTCKDCGRAVSMNKMCETPLQSAADFLKHLATHTVSHAFASIKCVAGPEPETVPVIVLAPALGVPARVERSECPIARPSRMSPEFGPSGFFLDHLPVVCPTRTKSKTESRLVYEIRTRKAAPLLFVKNVGSLPRVDAAQ
jgi:hypothetical protein